MNLESGLRLLHFCCSFLIYLLYVCECFACMHAYAPCVCLVSTEINSRVRLLVQEEDGVSCHVGTKNCT